MLILAIIPDALTIILSKIGPESVRKKIQKKFDLIKFSLERHEYMYQLGGHYPINGPEIPQIYKNVIHKNLEQVKERLNLGDDPNTTNSAGFSLLMQAVADGSYEIAKLLLERGANPNVINNLGRSPMCFAARYGYTNMVELLLQYNAIPNLYRHPEKTGPILASIEGEHIDILKLLLDNIELKEENGKFIEYDYALKTKNPAIIRLIAEKIRKQGVVTNASKY
jgi:ankyrin repeat protein